MTRAVREGVIAMLDDDLRKTISDAYGAISRANARVCAEVNQDCNDRALGHKKADATKALEAAPQMIRSARDKLLEFLRSPDEEEEARVVTD